MRLKYLCVALTIAAILLKGTATPAFADSGSSDYQECKYFAETGQYVCDEFLAYFNAHGGLEIFGYPRSQSFFDTALGRKVQYFQRARFEMYSENPEPYRVQQGLLGDELGFNKFPPAVPEDIPDVNSTVHYYFPETGHTVSFSFLQFLRENGGLDVFGYPRSEFMFEDGYIVQYFQRMRVEWHPDSEPQMALTDLGDIYIEHFGVSQQYLQSEGRTAGQEGVAKPTVSVAGLTADATVRHAIIGKDQQQTIFIYVTDQQNRPVENVTGHTVVHYLTGDQTLEILPTDANGFSSQSFYVIPTAEPGEQVEIDIFIEYEGLGCKTSSFFLPWW